MLRKYSVPVLLFAQVIIFLLLLSVAVRQPTASASEAAAPQDMPQAQIISHGQYVWSYAAKFVCGFQRTAAPGQVTPGEPILKPGNYATEINIHNPNYKQTPLRKKFVMLVNRQTIVREPEQVGVLVPGASGHLACRSQDDEFSLRHVRIEDLTYP